MDKESLQNPVHSGDRSRTCLHHTPPHCTEPDLAMPFIEAIAPATPPSAISWRRAHDDCEHHTTAQQPSLHLSRSLLTVVVRSLRFSLPGISFVRRPPFRANATLLTREHAHLHFRTTITILSLGRFCPVLCFVFGVIIRNLCCRLHCVVYFKCGSHDYTRC